MTDTHAALMAHPAQVACVMNQAQQAAFIDAYFEQADPEERDRHSPEALIGMALGHWQLLTVTPPSGVQVRVTNPNLAEDGYTSAHTLVQIVHPDMPFLVDSVAMAVNRGGRRVHWVVHPMLVVSRDAAGGVCGAQRARPGEGGEVVSLISVWADRVVSDEDRRALAADVLRSLADVRAAVEDWSAMLARVDTLRAASALAPLSPPARAEGVAFLAWLQAQHYTFLGLRDYTLVRDGDVLSLRAEPASGLGLLRGTPRTAQTVLNADALAFAEADELVLMTKALTRSTVHRPAWLDSVSIKRYDDQGRLCGETRLLGLLTSRAYTASVAQIPLVRTRVAAVMAQAGLIPDSHDAKALQVVLEQYPRDELMQIDAATLGAHAMGILRLQERQRCRVFLRRDLLGRYTSAQVYVPRDRYHTDLRERVGEALRVALGGDQVAFTPTLSDAPMARIHYLVQAQGVAPRELDLAALDAQIERLAQRWEDSLRAQLLLELGDHAGLALAKRYASAFGRDYQSACTAQQGAHDAQVLAALSPEQPLAVRLMRSVGGAPGAAVVRLYSLSKVALSDSLPVLEHLGLRALDERPYAVDDPQGARWVHELGVQLPASVDLAAVRARFEALFVRVWMRTLDDDALNALVLRTQLDGDAIAVLRAYARYFKQIGYAYGTSYIAQTLLQQPLLAQALWGLFVARLQPGVASPVAQSQADAAVRTLLADVASLEQDHVLRQFQGAIGATLRTNFWQCDAQGARKPVLSFKFDAQTMPGLPLPRPHVEIWVYSARFEGIHLRFGPVARGGLRWSDRHEDFRTEVLGLVKAQQVKNTVIVPVGSKGGFVLKRPVSPADREAWLTEGQACYQLYLGGLLDLTDNLNGGAMVPPPDVVRHDGDDPYLVVAADKGTASFSDLANAVSARYGYWLGDAFASGGSVGYDHKKMGITARGAWISAQRHFRARGVDVQTQTIRVVGIGDMSGDVFGNGLLRSSAVALVAAFDHRHIFLDPNPDVARAFAERQRLFALPRSSWADYDPAVLSEGGGVYPRSAKQIALTPPVQALLGVADEALDPPALIRALLRAPVELIYNGGIGTYVKARTETHTQVGDKANDAIRVNGAELRCAVLVEGGNLGCTQLGRVEFAQAGGRLYTDAIDNSAGVDCSDHEVNIKIALNQVVEAGNLTRKQRDALLVEMTDDVAHLVLQDNNYQTQALDVAVHRGTDILDGQQGLMRWLEGAGRLNRAIEFLPDDAEIARRRAAGLGLTAPENAVLLAYAKMAVFDDLVASNLPDDAFFAPVLSAYFPPALVQRHALAVAQHPLRRQIIATSLANSVVNRMGATFVNFLAAESAAQTADVVRAYTLARAVFGLEALWDRIDALDGVVSSACQLDLLVRLTRTAQRASRRLLRLRSGMADMPQALARLQPMAQTLNANLAQWLPASALARWQDESQALATDRVPADLAQALAALELVFPVIDLAEGVVGAQAPLEAAARHYFAVDDELALATWRASIDRLPTGTLWQTQARASARDELQAIAAQLSAHVLARGDGMAGWMQQHARVLARLADMRAALPTQAPDLAPITVALRELRQLLVPAV